MAGNIRVEFKINEPVDDLKAQESKTARVREILKARLKKLREAAEQNQLESISSVNYERDEFDGRERWKIYLEGKGGLETYATSLRNEAASVLSAEDEFLVSVIENNT